jgi:hypothetical protein
MPHPAGMKLRPSISGLFGVVVFATMSVCASAAAISTMTGLVVSDDLAITKVAQRHYYAARARNRNRGGSRNHNANGSDDPPVSDWYPHDSTQLPFGSARWWNQIQLETGGGR